MALELKNVPSAATKSYKPEETKNTITSPGGAVISPSASRSIPVQNVDARNTAKQSKEKANQDNAKSKYNEYLRKNEILFRFFIQNNPALTATEMNIFKKKSTAKSSPTPSTKAGSERESLKPGFKPSKPKTTMYPYNLYLDTKKEFLQYPYLPYPTRTKKNSKEE